MKEDFICALSGVTPTDEESDSTLGDLPEGWIEITIKRVFPNQRYFILQQLKNQAVSLTLAQIPEEQREEALESVRVQVDAQYYSFESSLKDYEEESDTIYISPPENDPAILEEYQKFAIIDDLLATGGTLNCVISILNSMGKVVTGASVVAEIKDLLGRDQIPCITTSEVIF